MIKENIAKVEIDCDGRVFISPESLSFNLIYRTATEVHWNEENKTLYSPIPREWTHVQWVQHIVNVVRNECQIELVVTEHTLWVNTPQHIRREIIEST